MREPVAAIVPSAGHSTRMGVPKAMLRWKGRSFLEIIVRHLSAEQVPSFVVHRPDQEVLANLIADMEMRGLAVRPAVNPLPDSEMVDSVAFGLRRLDALVPSWRGILVWPSDCPAVDPADLERVLEQADKTPDRVVVPVWEGRRGHPTYFPRGTVEPLLTARLPFPGSLRDLLDRSDEPIRVPAGNKGVVLNLNDPEALGELQRIEDNPSIPRPAIDNVT